MIISAVILAAAIAEAAGPGRTPMPGVSAAADQAAAGVEAYRVFFTDGYGRPRPVVSFERRPAQPPKVVVYAAEGKMETAAPASVWQGIQDAALYADRELAPLKPDQVKSEVVICTHSWSAAIEIINSPESHERAEAVRTARQNTCEPGLATQFGFELARLAVEQFSACAKLKPEGSRNDVERLALCARLSGDTHAAADLVNQIGDQLALQAEQADAWDAWMGTNASPELNWSGQIIKDGRSGKSQIGHFLATQEKAWIQHMWAQRFTGIDGRTVKVTGIFTRLKPLDEPAKDVDEQADYEQVWTFDTAAQEWNLATWRVGSFSPRVRNVRP